MLAEEPTLLFRQNQKVYAELQNVPTAPASLRAYLYGEYVRDVHVDDNHTIEEVEITGAVVVLLYKDLLYKNYRVRLTRIP